jgi:4-amino-4-deoxy-L-arabinose transferase-like glycosyltransferase
MSTDEAYYWFWGQHPQLSYYDHPAMVAWLFNIGAHLDHFFHHSQLQISRIPGIIMAHTSLYFWYLILKKHLNDEQLGTWLIFAMFSPLWGVGSIILTPDIPLIFFWSIAIYIFVEIVECEGEYLIDYGFLGAALGLGFCSKYHIVLFIPAAFLYILVERQWRLIKPSGILICILCGILFSMPVLYWNAQHDFMSFKFQLQHGLDTTDSWRLRWPIEYILGQFFLVFPTVFLMALKKPKLESLKVLYYFAWFPILFFLMTSMKSKVEANWPIAAYPALICLGYYGLQKRTALWVTLVVWIVAWLFVFGQVLRPWMPVDERELKTYELKKFDRLIEIFKEDHAGTFASSYQMASLISYKTRFDLPLTYKAIGMSRRDYFDFQPQALPVSRSFHIVLENEQKISAELKALGYQEVSGTRINDEFRLVQVDRK